MTVFSCADSFVDKMTCVYEAWSSRLGHSNVRLVLGPVSQRELFTDYVHVEADAEKAEKVIRAVVNKISYQAYQWIYSVSLSSEPESLDVLYRFLLYGFHYGGKVCGMLSEPVVMRMLELRRRVGNEAHYFREFLRFVSVGAKVLPADVLEEKGYPVGPRMGGGKRAVGAGDSAKERTALYLAHIEPKDNVLLYVASHFADRMPSEYFVIVDDGRKIAAVHPAEEACYLCGLSEAEIDCLKEYEKGEDTYTALWKGYFDAAAIRERTNPSCQRTHFPLWMRRHVTEFVHGQ